MFSLQSVVRNKLHKPPFIVVHGDAGVGKAQPVSSIVKTPYGDKKIGELNVGDQIFGADGNIQTIEGVYPQGIQEVYKVTFRDGTFALCNIDHLWTVDTAKVRRTMSVRNMLSEGFLKAKGTQTKFKIPLCEPVQYSESEFFIKPYLLGALIADGYLCGNTIGLSVSDKDITILEKVTELLPEGFKITFTDSDLNCKQYRIVKSGNVKLNQVKVEISNLGLDTLSLHKFIPRAYLHGSISQRKALLRGLMDCDGSCLKNRTMYHTNSKQLAFDVRELVNSLGGVAIIHSYNRSEKQNTEYRVNIKVKFNPFSLERKADEWHESKQNIPCRFITNIESTGAHEEQVCIKVSNSDHLYMTNNFIVTHNTTVAAGAPNNIFIPVEDGLGMLDVDTFPEPANMTEVKQMMNVLLNEDHNYQWVTIDSATALEKKLWKELCTKSNADSIEEVGGGYGKGFTRALEEVSEFITDLRKLREKRGMGIILIAHTKITTFNPPDKASYDQYTLNVNNKLADFIHTQADIVGYAELEQLIKQEDKGFNQKQGKATETGRRILHCYSSKKYTSKNRYGIQAPIDLDFGVLMQNIAANMPQNQQATTQGN